MKGHTRVADIWLCNQGTIAMLGHLNIAGATCVLGAGRTYTPVEVGIIRLSLHGGCICRLGYFPFQPVVHNWSIKGCGMCCHVCGKVHIKDPFCCLSERVAYVSIAGFLKKKLKKVRMTIIPIADDVKINTLSRGVIKQNKETRQNHSCPNSRGYSDRQLESRQP